MAIATPDLLLEPAEQTITDLPLGSVMAAPDNPRRELGDLDELAASMRELGLLQPLVVTPRMGKFMVVCGHRRHAAATKAKLASVPAIVRDLDEPQRIKAMLVENCQRTDLAPLEEARAYQTLVELGLSQRQIAGDVGKAQSHVSKRLSLLDLPARVQAKVDSGGIALADALELAKLKDHPERLERAASGIGRGSFGMGADYYVRKELDDLKREQKVAAARARAEKKGWPIVETARDQAYWFTPPKGTFKLGQSYDELPLDAKTHEKEPCHAVGIEHKTGEFVPLCTDRSRHPKLKTYGEKLNSARSRETAEEKQRREQRQQLDEAKAKRADYIRGLLAKKTPLPRADAPRLFVAALLDGLDGYSYAEQACAWLGIHPDVDLTETTVARAGALHVVVQEDENKDGATIITAVCGFRGLGAGISRPDDRDTDPDPADLCPDCLRKTANLGFDEYAQKLRERLADANEQTINRIGVAVALAWHEQDRWSGVEGGYLRFLEHTGYTLTDAEKAVVAEQDAYA